MSQIQRYDLTTALQDIETLTGNTGGAVGPDGVGNVDFVGDGTVVTVTGNPGGNTLTISLVNQSIVTAQTVGAVTADLFTFTVPASSAVTVSGNLVAAKDDYTEAFGGRILGTARRQAAGGAAESFENNTIGGDDATVSATFVISGNDYVLRVTGAAGDTYNWTAQIMYTTEST